MKNNPAARDTNHRRRKCLYAALSFTAVLLVVFVVFVHPFLAVTRRVDADILVVEGWIPDYMFPAVAAEFREKQYRFLLVSGLQNDPGNITSAAPDFAHA